MARHVTDEERADWEEVAKHTKRVKKKRAPEVSSPSGGGRVGAYATKTEHTSPSLTLPGGEGIKTKPKKSAAPAAPLAVLPKREAERMFKPHARIQARIDLHGMTQDEAHEALNHFIFRAQAAGKRHVAIITGKGSRGEGVLRRAVPRWLELPELRPLVAAIAHAAPEKGGEGVLHVLLRKM